MRTAIKSSTFRLFGVDLQCHVLDDGTRVIDEQSIKAFFEALKSGATSSQSELDAYAKWAIGDEPTASANPSVECQDTYPEPVGDGPITHTQKEGEPHV